MATPREHIEEIRKTKFSIGGQLNPLTEDLHQAVQQLSVELYTKDVHFLMELIQNAEDNEYSEGVDPSLQFVVTSRDITATGAPATLLVFNNEKGFSSKNIDSICSVGRSTKKGNRNRGFIGEKGIGFKSVFVITAQPYIFSNGYQIRFSKEPCPHCNVGYIVPEWVEENPTLSDIQQIYGSGSALPTTILILPLKPDKVKPVKQELSSMHPEVLLFLTKIKRLSVREDNEDPRLNTVSAIAISSETDLVARKNIDAESYTLHLSAEETGTEFERECIYYMWKQKFPVKQEFRDERRMEVEEWVITLAFPYGERLHRGASSPGIYAFLPTQMFTNLPFIIQADFLLASSRENIRLDSKWNQGILNCVPSAFINAFISLVRNVEDAPVSSLPPYFRFLPVQSSPYDELNIVRDSIKAQLVEENIVPSEPQAEQKLFHKPREVGRLMPSFWNILRKARDQEVSLLNLSSHGRYVLCQSFDEEKYDHILSFLGVELVGDEWYAKCIQSSNLVIGVSEDVYLELLMFIAENWGPKFLCTNIKNIPLIKYVDTDESVSLCSLSAMRTGERKVCLSRQSYHISWLIDWNKEFISVARLLFMPTKTQEAIQSCSKNVTLVKWLAEEMKVFAVNVHEYAVCLLNSLDNDRKPVIAYAHFLYHSLCENYISYWEVNDLCSKMPLVNNYGYVRRERKGVIVPAKGSKWAGLTVTNLWIEEEYVELGEAYMSPGCFAGKVTPENVLLEFLKVHSAAADVPAISAPNARLPTVSATLTKPNAFLLLDWIRHLKYERRIPEKFLECIRNGSWLKVTLNGFSGVRPPSLSFVPTSSWGDILQSGSVFVDIPLIDKSWYGEIIEDYKEELKTVGVRFEFREACEYMGKHLMSLAASSTLTSGNVISVLRFIRFLRSKYLSPDDFILSIKQGRWLKTSAGFRSPEESVLSDKEWTVASMISNIPFIDQKFYGEDICQFQTELELLGVVVSFRKNYQLIIDNLKSPSCLSFRTPETVLLMLECMHLSGSSDKLVRALKETKCLMTEIGYKRPDECLLFHPDWGCMLQVFSGLPLIDNNFYEMRIHFYRSELKETGVVVDFEETAKLFASYFKHYASSASITKENVASFLFCCKTLKGTPYRFPADLEECIGEEKWLRTRLGDYRSPTQCILFSPDWNSILPICLLPFIDDSDNYYGENIHEYKKELKTLGVVVEFKDGVKFVASGLQLPQNPSCISQETALALLECIQILLEDDNSLPVDFMRNFMREVSQPWLKTHAGYRPPGKCLLFDSKFGSYLKQTDGPFIDEEFYGSKLTAYRKELSAIGVIVEVEQGCPLIASHLDLHDELSTFVRVYNYLSQFKWEPDTEADRRIWIPKAKGNLNGEWVSPDQCVIYDNDRLFGLQFTVLENYFQDNRNLLLFFSHALKVKSRPSIEDYCKLWKVWESSEKRLSHAECCKFWGYVLKNWNSKADKLLSEALVKVPVNSGSDEILLLNKCDVFLADDLLLKDLFEQSSPHLLFVWYPQPSLPALPRATLLEIYRKIGVRSISESVQKEELSLENGIAQQVTSRDDWIGKALLRLILGFLADPTINMEAERRYKAVQGLLNLPVCETTEPITVSYNLPLSSGEILNVRASRKLRWDRENFIFLTQKLDWSGGEENIIEFATYFSEAISNGVLWENTDHIPALSELIKLAFVLRFNEKAVGFLMKSKNLQIFLEDEVFLNSAFPSD